MLRVTQGHWKWHHLRPCKSSYSHSVVTMALSCIVSKIKQDVSQNCNFHTPCINAPVRVGASDDDRNFWYMLQCGAKYRQKVQPYD